VVNGKKGFFPFVSRIWRGSRLNIRVLFCPIGKILIRRTFFGGRG
jgi:hypothetical protein